MLHDSGQFLSKILRYKSPWLALTLIYTVLCAFGANILWGFEAASDNELTASLPLFSEPFTFESSRDSAYVLIKHYYSSTQYNFVSQPFYKANCDSLSMAPLAEPPGFDFGFTNALDAIPPRVLWLKPPVDVSIDGERRLVYAVFFAPKGRRLNIKYSQDASPAERNFYVTLVMLGAGLPRSGMVRAKVEANKFMWANHRLSNSDVKSSVSADLLSLIASPLNLPVPLIGDGEGLKLSQNVLGGEKLKSTMFCLPKSEEELREFLAARHIEFSEGRSVPPPE